MNVKCPCGAETLPVEQVRVEGVMSGDGAAPVKKHYYAALYHNWYQGDLVHFCSADCSLKWDTIFWQPYCKHVEIDDATKE
jgi:hypothetical protein